MKTQVCPGNSLPYDLGWHVTAQCWGLQWAQCATSAFWTKFHIAQVYQVSQQVSNKCVCTEYDFRCTIMPRWDNVAVVLVLVGSGTKVNHADVGTFHLLYPTILQPQHISLWSDQGWKILWYFRTKISDIYQWYISAIYIKPTLDPIHFITYATAICHNLGCQHCSNTN